MEIKGCLWSPVKKAALMIVSSPERPWTKGAPLRKLLKVLGYVYPNESDVFHSQKLYQNVRYTRKSAKILSRGTPCPGCRALARLIWKNLAGNYYEKELYGL